MHQALLVDEILRQIFELCYSAQDEGSQRLFAGLARCCKAWKDPALDRLWQNLASVVPLLSLISNFSRVKDTCTITGSVSDAELLTFASYARRVRRVNHRQDVQLDPSVVRLLFALKDTSPYGLLFSRLETLYLLVSDTTLPELPVFMSNLVQELDLFALEPRSSPFTDEVCDYLSELFRISRYIRSVHIRGTLNPRALHCLGAVTTLRSLKIRTVHGVTPVAFFTVAQLPLLEDLELHAHKLLDFKAFLSTPESSSDGPFFSALRSLHIRGILPLIEYTLNRLRPNSLHSLRLDTGPYTSTPTSFQPFLNLLHRFSSSLTYLQFEQRSIMSQYEYDPSIFVLGSQPSWNDFFFTMDTLYPLAKMGQLRHLIVDCTVPPSLSDEDCDKLFSWWPLMEHLDLGTSPAFMGYPDYQDTWRPKATFASLESVVKRLPKLRALTCPLDCTSGSGKHKTSTVDPSSPIPRQEKLRTLNIGYSRQEAVVDFTGQLSQMFPSLTKVRCDTFTSTFSTLELNPEDTTYLRTSSDSPLRLR